MKLARHACLVASLCLSFACSGGSDGDFLLTTRLDTPQGQFENEIYFVDDTAVETIDGAIESIFDLSEMTWWQSDHGTVSLEQCETWAEASAEHSKESATAMPDSAQRTLALRLIDPQFAVEEDGSTLVIRNPYLQYRIESSTELSESQVARLHAYDRLNAYKKAMTGGPVPPYSQLAVTEELATRNIVPLSIEMVMSTGDPGAEAGAPGMSATMAYSYAPLSPEQSQEMKKLLGQ